MKRKDFLKLTALAGVGSLLEFSPLHAAQHLLEDAGLKRLVFLHTNDMHSHVDPFPENDPKHPGAGGMARRAKLIEMIRAHEPHVILLDAGDIFQGTPYFNYYGGELEFKLMSEMHYDAATIGNHDFDNGLEGLDRMLPFAKFPFINVNYDFSDTILAGKTQRHKVMNKGGYKIGIVGVGVALEGLVDKRNYGATRYLSPIEEVQKEVNLLKTEFKCDLIVCLSHLGYEYKNEKVSDLVLASETYDIDLIIGGHTHTFLPAPTLVKNKKGKQVLVNQVGWAGIHLGRVDFIVDRHGNAQNTSSTMYKISKKTISI